MDDEHKKKFAALEDEIDILAKKLNGLALFREAAESEIGNQRTEIEALKIKVRNLER